MAVTTITASTSDGDVKCDDAVYSNAANGTGTLGSPINTSNELWVGQLVFGDYGCYEAFVSFDLSSIPAHHTVSSATLRTYLVTDGSGDDFLLGAREYDWGTTVTTADFLTPAEITALAGGTLANLSTNGIGATGANKNWNSTGLATAVENNIGGTLKLLLYSGSHRVGAAPSGAEYVVFAAADVAGVGNDPAVIIEHVGVLVDHTPTGAVVVGGAATVHPLLHHHPTGGAVAGGAATVAFVHGPSVDSDIKIEWDFDNDGDFDGTYEDVTDYVLSVETMSGRSFPSNLTGRAEPGKLRFTVVNDDDRFTYFNTSSPLNTSNNSLTSGRKVRVRTTESTADDPVLLVRDRFNRSDSTGLGSAETGETWTNQAGTAYSISSRVAAAPDSPTNTVHISTVDCGANDYYAQVELRQLTTAFRREGLVLRFTDTDNYALVRLSGWSEVGTGPILEIRESVSGTATILESVQLDTGWEGLTLGGSVLGTTCTAYIGGVEFLSTTLNTANSSASEVGFYAFIGANTGRAVEFNNFYVWDKVAAETEGILWTGNVTKITTDTVPGRKIAVVEAEGVLAKVAKPDIGAPRLPIGGISTGVLVGDVLSRAGVLHPPAPLDTGAITTGPIGIPDGKALELARMFETVEQGFIHETNEGQVSFHDSSSRTNATSEVIFSDKPGAQFGFLSISPQDHVDGVVNRATTGVAAEAPTLVDEDGIGRSGGSHVDVLMPTLTEGELVVVFIASSVDGDQWQAPLWWVDHRNMREGLGLRVFSHWVGSDTYYSGATVRFYNDASGSAGAWVASIYQVQNWFGSYRQGVAMGEPTSGANPGALVHGWGRYPTLFFTVRAGIGGTGGGMSFSTVAPPDGYGGIYGTIVGSSVTYDAGVAVAHKYDCTDEENPTALNGFSNISSSGVDETVVFAVRGYNGPYTKATLDNPNLSRGGEGIFVTAEDVDSQDDHNAVLDFTAPALFATEAAATTYVNSVVSTYADDRPIVTISFQATYSGHYRNQAIRRRLGDKITLVADGDAGLGVEGDFFIENIGHRWDNGGKTWLVTWQLSPA